MSALLHQNLQEIAGQILGRVITSQPLTIPEMSELAVAIQRAAVQARAVEGGNVVPMPRRPVDLRAVFPEARL